MKKLVLILSLILVSVVGVKAQGGYRGFVDVGPSIGERGVSLDVTTAHGYQFNKNWFLGGGIGLINIIETSDYDSYYDSEEWISIPLFAKVRFDMLSEKSWTFFAEANLGPCYDLEYEGVYFYGSTMLGVRKRITERIGINMGIGCSVIPSSYYSSEYYDEVEPTAKFNIKVGVDF
ncbi:MAG: hypothetical protein II235_07315 [Muribaculaceae bacterium]|nr:hypothetical protein [Muribaculaceae bacterium]MEE1297333.1 hypothetical protein [Muribaculaceae bacterium]